MTDIRFVFESSAFNDPPEVRAKNVNGLGGYTLAAWMRSKLIAAGAEVSQVDAEDWGWYCDASRDGARYFLGFGMDDEPPVGGHIMISRHRSLSDKLLGRNKLQGNDALVALVRTILEEAPEISKLAIET